MATRPSAICPVTNGRHKWAHVRDYVETNARTTSRGTLVKMSARGLYKCECGAERAGKSVGGL